MSDVYVIGTPDGAKRNQWLQLTNDSAVVQEALENPSLVVKPVPESNLRPRRRRRRAR
jgi:hypothetical protein